MSTNNIIKQLSSERLNPNITDKSQIRKAFLLTDSKGRYLLPHAESEAIEFVFESGANSFHGQTHVTKTDRLLNKLFGKIRGLSNPFVLIWLGTCDFTRLDYPYVVIRENADVSTVFANFTAMADKIRSVNPSSEVVFLECPMYSIQIWNTIKGHANPLQFEEADKELILKIRSLNTFFHDNNTIYTPKISEDFNKNTKNQKGHARYYYNCRELTTDGIHPIDIVAKLWLKKFQKLVYEKCFT